MPRRKDGTYYSTDPVEEVKGFLAGDEDDTKRIAQRLATAKQYGAYGAKVGSVIPLGGSAVGGALGAIGGFILGDREIVFPIDMVAVPAFELPLMYQGKSPSFQIYIKEGEVLNQVVLTDAQEAALSVEQSVDRNTFSSPKKKRAPSAYSKKYSKAFDSVKGSYKTKSGKWKKDGFKRAVKAAHRLAKKGGKK